MGQACFCGAGFLASGRVSWGRLLLWGRLSSWAWYPSPTAARAPNRPAAAKWSKPPGLPCRRSRRQSHKIPSCAGVPTPSGPQDCALHLKPPPPQVEQAARLAMPAVTPAEQHIPELHGSSKRQPPPGLAAWPARLRAPPHPAAPSGACRQACHAGGHAGRATQSRTVRKSNAIRRQDWRRGTHDCALHLKPPPQSGACRQACHAGGRAGRATHTRAAREFQSPSAAKTGGVARTTAPSTSTRRFSSHLRVLRVLSGLVFSVPSVVCLLRVLRVLCTTSP